MNNIDTKKIELAIEMIIEAIGEDKKREGLVNTPKRIGKMYSEIFSGIGENIEEQIQVMFNEDYEEMIVVKDIPVKSICEHHFMPFIGKAHIVYIPSNNKITGLSKLVRLVDVACKKPQLQERLTKEIATAIDNKLNPRGILVKIEAEHMCISFRGIKKEGTKTVTCCKKGIFQESEEFIREALELIDK